MLGGMSKMFGKKEAAKEDSVAAAIPTNPMDIMSSVLILPHVSHFELHCSDAHYVVTYAGKLPRLSEVSTIQVSQQLHNQHFS